MIERLTNSYGKIEPILSLISEKNSPIGVSFGDTISYILKIFRMLRCLLRSHRRMVECDVS